MVARSTSTLARRLTLWRRRADQRGANAVEFALVVSVFITLLFAVIEFSRVLFTWNAAVEATRFGARVATVCDVSSAAVVSMMQTFLPQVNSSNVTVTYTPSGCTKANCESVTVGIGNISLQTYIPFLSLNLPMPSFSTYIVRESLETTNAAGQTNPTCTNPWTSGLPSPAIWH
jgi:Flp pilus assembly pilin Flp